MTESVCASVRACVCESGHKMFLSQAGSYWALQENLQHLHCIILAVFLLLFWAPNLSITPAYMSVMLPVLGGMHSNIFR